MCVCVVEGATWKLWDRMSHGCGDWPESCSAPTGGMEQRESDKRKHFFSFWCFWKVCYSLLFLIAVMFFCGFIRAAGRKHSCLLWQPEKYNRCPGQEGESDVILVSSE